MEDVKSAHFVGIGENDELLDFLKNWGLPITQTNLRVLVDSGLVGWQMARQGLGISAMTDDIARLKKSGFFGPTDRGFSSFFIPIVVPSFPVQSGSAGRSLGSIHDSGFFVELALPRG